MVPKNKKKNKKKKGSLFKKLTNLVTNRNEEEEGIFTPSTGNTPHLIKSMTPICCDEYNEEYISSIIGDDTFDTDYIYSLFNEEHKCLWYNNNISSSLRSTAITDDIYSS